MPLRQLPASRRAWLRGARGGGARRVRSRSSRVLPADLRGSQRAFLVQRAASREVTFCIIARNASSKSIPCELARQMTTNRMSASSIAREPSGSSGFFVFSPNRWFSSRASSPTSSVRRARLVSGGKRSEEHTSELQSRLHLVCRLLLEKKKEPADKTTLLVART